MQGLVKPVLMKKNNHENPAPQKLASAFLAVSIVVGVYSPQNFNLGSLLAGTEDTISTSVSDASNKATEGDSFQIPETLNYYEASQFLFVNDNSLIASKIPPTNRYAVSSTMWIFATAYSSTPDQTDDTPFITASGNHVRDGIIAANFLPMYTKVRFPTLYGDKIFVVEDRMNKRYYYKADIWMKTREEALRFGVKNIPIEILREI